VNDKSKESYYYYFITGKISKLFNKVLDKFDVVRNWAIITKVSL